MQNSQIAATIKSRCKEKKISITQLLSECEITKSFVYDLEKRDASPSVDRLAKIADYLDCSVDYLLGRTDNPNTSGNSVIQSSNIVNGNNGDHSPLTVTETEQQDEMTQELVKAFQSMSFTDKMEIMNAVLKKMKK